MSEKSENITDPMRGASKVVTVILEMNFTRIIKCTSHEKLHANEIKINYANVPGINKAKQIK